MKICGKCGYRDFEPDKKCPECGDKYGDFYNCNPVVGAVEDYDVNGGTNGYRQPTHTANHYGSDGENK